MTTVLTRPDPKVQHGSHRTRWLAVLGLVLSSVGVGLFWLGPELVERTAPPPDPVGAPVIETGPILPAFVVEPEVVLAEAPPQPHQNTGVPSALVVPKLGINAPVVGIKVKKGVLIPPDDPQTLGWWRKGAQPGAVYGGALITGHTVSTGGGAMDDLETLRKGDVVRVVTGKGNITYAVTGVTIYRKATLAKDAERVFTQGGPGRLVLITCEDWNGSSYDSNAIVFAERVG